MNQVKIGKTTYQVVSKDETIKGQVSWEIKQVLKSGKLGKADKTLILSMFSFGNQYSLWSGPGRGLPKIVDVAWLGDDNLAADFFKKLETAYL